MHIVSYRNGTADTPLFPPTQPRGLHSIQKFQRATEEETGRYRRRAHGRRRIENEMAGSRNGTSSSQLPSPSQNVTTTTKNALQKEWHHRVNAPYR
jgi:hypothetical protein